MPASTITLPRISLKANFSFSIIAAKNPAKATTLNNAIDTLVESKKVNALLIASQPESWQITPKPKKQNKAFAG